ncbi:MAG: response regulator [Spirochaetaceae bacterium]|jgi:signal transduction histidine kinase/CheY-like chemotaxis protein|nr:response regulator [Spirochaetaceae bacterium]
MKNDSERNSPLSGAKRGAGTWSPLEIEGNSGRGIRVVIAVFYAAALVFVVLQLFNALEAPRDTSFYRNLMDYEAYARRGFDLEDTVDVPDPAGGVWKAFPRNSPRRIVNAGLPGLPKRAFLSPLGKPPQEFTILIPFDLDGGDLRLLEEPGRVPGLHLGLIGDNWEVYLNGELLMSEMHYDGERILSGRTWRAAHFPVKSSLFREGANMLAFRILGDPTWGETGLYYRSPYYFADYRIIEQQNNTFPMMIICGMYLFSGIYYLLLFFGIRRQTYNLYYGLFSMFSCIYYLTRSPAINTLIPDSNIAMRIEYLSMFLMASSLGVFLEVYSWGRVIRATKIYCAVWIALGLSQLFFCLQYSDEVIILWNITTPPFLMYFFFHDLVYAFVKENRGGIKGSGFFARLSGYGTALLRMPIGGVLIGASIAFTCVIIEIIDTIFFHHSLQLSRYGFFVFIIGTAFRLSERVTHVHNQLGLVNASLEESNVALETAVQERTRELEHQARLAEAASRAKSEFLAQMSHEIRTPMNAVLGMSELAMRALREQQYSQALDYVSNIRNAGDNLLSIINDILDFSKIESGKVELVLGDYQLTSLLNDVINIISTRLNDRPVLFLARIESTLPSGLRGDEMRIRQILLNILGNAVKYTREGSITLTIKNLSPENPAAGESILLSFAVSDTGVGIKEEDMGKLFDQFSRIDIPANRMIEGTGLGLAITHNLCTLMDGNITVESRYGAGSTFTVTLPQLVQDSRPLAQVEAPETKRVLIYDQRRACAEAAAYTVENLGVSCAVALNQKDFLERLREGGWNFVFTSPALIGEVQQSLAGGPAVAVLLAEYGETPPPGAPVLALPVQPAQAANLLNGKADVQDYRWGEIPGTRFIAPDARILVVDDITTNLSVAEGLMAPYMMRIDSCTGGIEALRLVSERAYDLIFLDHMMPGMDGIETASAIRALDRDYAQTLPLIALTANVISGMREMFLEKGFNDYLSKPINVSELNDILKKWIPRSKQQTRLPAEEGRPAPETSVIHIDGVDTVQGLAMTGGLEAGYLKVLASFYRDSLERLPGLEEVPAGGDLGPLIISVHALKSASAVIGAEALSGEAAALEAAGRAGDHAVLRRDLPVFYERLSRTAAAIGEALHLAPEVAPAGAGTAGGAEELPPVLIPALTELRGALDQQDIGAINRIMDRLEAAAQDPWFREILEALSDQILLADFDQAVETVEALLGSGAGGGINQTIR